MNNSESHFDFHDHSSRGVSIFEVVMGILLILIGVQFIMPSFGMTLGSVWVIVSVLVTINDIRRAINRK